MKTLIWISLVIFCTALMLGCGNMAPEILPLQDLAQRFADGALTEQSLNEMLVSLPLEDIQQAWGPETGSLSGFFGLIWPLDPQQDLVLYFSPDQRVESVCIHKNSGPEA